MSNDLKSMSDEILLIFVPITYSGGMEIIMNTQSNQVEIANKFHAKVK